MLVLDDAGEGHVTVGVVDHRIPLIVGHRQHFRVEPHRAVLQMAQREVEKGIYRSRVENVMGQGLPRLPVGKEIGGGAHLNVLEQGIGEHIVAPDGYALVAVVEIVVVIDHAHGQPLDDEGRQLGARPSPLLLGVALDEPVIDVAPHQQQGLLLQILRLAPLQPCLGLGPLSVEHLLCLLRSGDSPHLVKGVHVEGQIVELALIVGQRGVGIPVAGSQPVDKIPYFPVGSVEDMRPILMHLYACHGSAMDVSPCVRPPLHHQAALAPAVHQMRKGGTHQSGTHNEIVVRFRVHGPVFIFL